MPDTETFGSFLRENKKLVGEYIEIRLNLYRLQLTRAFSRSAGYLLWILISLVLLSLFFVFAGIVTGFWLSALTGSYVKGFGITALLVLFILGILTLLRRALFINPVIRSVIRSMDKQKGPENKDEL